MTVALSPEQIIAASEQIQQPFDAAVGLIRGWEIMSERHGAHWHANLTPHYAQCIGILDNGAFRSKRHWQSIEAAIRAYGAKRCAHAFAVRLSGNIHELLLKTFDSPPDDPLDRSSMATPEWVKPRAGRIRQIMGKVPQTDFDAVREQLKDERFWAAGQARGALTPVRSGKRGRKPDRNVAARDQRLSDLWHQRYREDGKPLGPQKLIQAGVEARIIAEGEITESVAKYIVCDCRKAAGIPGSRPKVREFRQ